MRRTACLRSSVLGSGVGGVFQLIDDTIANVDCDSERESLTDDDGEGEDTPSGTLTDQTDLLSTDHLPHSDTNRKDT